MKTYLLISPQPWGKMFLSKHNYAIELADQGHKVYFVNPPVYKKDIAISIQVRQEMANLYLVEYTLSVPLHILRFKIRFLYDFIIKKFLVSKLNALAEFDEIWCFEPNIFSNFKMFKAKKKLLFLVDQHDNTTLKKLSNEADGIATISSMILDYFSFSNKPKLLLNHGLNRTFTRLAEERLQSGLFYKKGASVKVAYVGNLLQGNRMDYKTIQLIIEQNNDITFHIYGPYEEKGNTLGSTTNQDLQAFINFLKNNQQVYLHGILSQEDLANQIQDMDAFLTCYNYLTDDNRSSNCHKIIEYLSTGKVAISNRILTYEKTTGLLEMPLEYTNENLPSLFKKVIAGLDQFNTPEKQKIRIDFALANTYINHTKTINHFLENLSPQ
ncbi:MAG: hypothetical protein M3Y85_11135 [Bacteroidota bacterium]|nr:hypothetical protein [Bacteroidota bacterium]